jgi:hypothetical protein
LNPQQKEYGQRLVFVEFGRDGGDLSEKKLSEAVAQCIAATELSKLEQTEQAVN